jgi:hypothetical protein
MRRPISTKYSDVGGKWEKSGELVLNTKFLDTVYLQKGSEFINGLVQPATRK